MSLEDLSVSSQAQDWAADVRLEIHLVGKAVQLAYEKVASQDVNAANRRTFCLFAEFSGTRRRSHVAVSSIALRYTYSVQ